MSHLYVLSGRSELACAHLCSRMYSLLQDQMYDFLSNFQGEVQFRVLSDSEIVLNQIASLPYQFKTWVASRVQEIHENFIDDAIQFIPTPLKNNVADILTREYFKDPEELPWANYSAPVDQLIS